MYYKIKILFLIESKIMTTTTKIVKKKKKILVMILMKLNKKNNTTNMMKIISVILKINLVIQNKNNTYFLGTVKKMTVIKTNLIKMAILLKILFIIKIRRIVNQEKVYLKWMYYN
jgi:hypothetical protein